MASSGTPPYVGLGDLGDTLGVQSWRIARLFETGALPEPPRIGRRRLIPKGMIPEIVDCLRARGWLPPSDPAASSSGAEENPSMADDGQQEGRQ